MVDLLFDMKYSSNLPDIAKEIKLFIGSHSNPISNISVDTLRTVFTALGLVPTLPPNVSLLTHQQFQKELDSKFKELRDFAQGLLVQNVLATDVKSLSGYTYVVNKLLEKI
jgi:ATP phosphoribosyltransferase regulatory subunit HisZ